MSWRNGLSVKSIWEGGEDLGGAGDSKSMIKMHSIKKKKRRAIMFGLWHPHNKLGIPQMLVIPVSKDLMLSSTDPSQI